MDIRPELLAKLAASQARIAGLVAPELEVQLTNSSINTHLRLCHFLAQICCESDFFCRLEEALNYTAPRIAAVWPRLADRADKLAGKPEALANAAYANKNGNGDEASGDGYRYRGRGLLQITGKANYAEAGFVAHPEMLSTAKASVASAISFWDKHKCNAAADRDDVVAVTKIINGGANGLADRKVLTMRAKLIFPVPAVPAVPAVEPEKEASDEPAVH